jgi:7-cyano-7-deazaguanine synthase in queuosine biosynthesis
MVKMVDEKGKSVLLFSGGMDSFIINYLFKPDILLYIKLGTQYEGKELTHINIFLNEYDLHDKFRLVTFDISLMLDKFFSGMEKGLFKSYELDNAHIPLRNLLFIEVASYFGDTVYLGAMRAETSKDKRKRFRRMTQSILSYCWNDKLGLGTKKKVKVEFPLKNYTKTKALKRYLKEGGSLEDLDKFTVSCYNSEVHFCGRCMSCFRRWVAEINNNHFTNKYEYSPYQYYNELLGEYNSFWKKFKVVFTPEFRINLPANIGAWKAKRKFKKMEMNQNG